ncbi:M23 family metallopeptidase [Sporolactobacillus sp. CPB3-1]|uniref:M23 family metallopeptidase n=1 Tax=Sporolactobacillus mangiferae TaxID=2940498 RepID=A0ABT0M8A9_9BACL|nr:M23 family metallopeptidase [Sporolactobacillus mangiferae]MCL1631112.1 M23 family metallopeptidase [Sporolactobacillus mangiferae]
MEAKLHNRVILIIILLISTSLFSKHAEASLLDQERKALFMKTAALTGVRWSIMAGCDQYARNIDMLEPDKKTADDLIHLSFSKTEWAGPLNPDTDDQNPRTIALFGGIGKDGNGDGRAKPDDAEDRLYTFADQIAQAGPGTENTRIGLWMIYQRGKAVDLIEDFARLFERADPDELMKHAFPIPKMYNYDYASTWGAKRGWGGNRIHEGTDIFADYGTPVRATAYGIVELIGWNKYGGWRIGVRDLHGNYHYYAHLNGYAPGLYHGAITKAGQVIGYVGSSGYGPKGTMGKFPPHLHYGLYRDNGRKEYSVDPYPALRSWERQSTR